MLITGQHTAASTALESGVVIGPVIFRYNSETDVGISTVNFHQ